MEVASRRGGMATPVPPMQLLRAHIPLTLLMDLVWCPSPEVLRAERPRPPLRVSEPTSTESTPA